MAYQFTSPSFESSSAHHTGVLTSGLTSTNPNSLDLNLSQKASQNFLRGYDETENSHHKATEASTRPQLDSVLKASEVLISNANGGTVLNAKGPFEQRVHEQEHSYGLHPQQKQDTDSVSAATRTPLNNPSVAVVKPGVPVASEPATTPAGQKRKSPRVEKVSNAQKELLQGGTVVPEDAYLLENGPNPITPSLKRKSLRVKQTTSDTTKKVILALEANDDEVLARPKGRPRGNSDVSKDGFLDTTCSTRQSWSAQGATPDWAERHLLLEERKIRLAEQRFLLEEKKLHATIEIGKGLLISMERMTNTISNLGNSMRSH